MDTQTFGLVGDKYMVIKNKRIAWNKGNSKYGAANCPYCNNLFKVVVKSKTNKLTNCCSNKCAALMKYHCSSVFVKCLTCKKLFRTTQSHVLLGKSYCSNSCSYQSETKKDKLRKRMSGSNNRFWKGGITPKNVLIRNSKKYKIWRKKVFERDNYTCLFCNARCGNGEDVVLNVDHIKPFAYYPELRFDMDNARTLCLECHKKTDTYLNKGRQLMKTNYGKRNERRASV